MIITSLIGLAFSSNLSLAATQYSDDPLPAPEVHFMTDEEYLAKMKIAKSRKPAQAENDSVQYATAFSDSFKNLEAQIIGGQQWQNGKEVTSGQPSPGIHTPYDIDDLLVALGKNYDGLDPDAKFVGAQLLAMQPWRSFIWRVRPLFEKNSKFVDSYAIVLMRAILSGTNTYIPTKEWKAGFAWLTQPYPGADKKMINTEVDLYNFVRKEVQPAINKLATRINGLDFSKPIYFDNKLFYSDANFVSPSDRFVRLGEAERQSFMAGVYLAISGIDFSLAYDWDGLMATFDRYAVAYGMNAALNPDTMTSQDRVQALRSKPLLFTLRKGKDGTTDRAVASAKAARAWYLDGVRYAKLSWTQLQRDANNASAYANLYDPRAFVPFTRTINATFQNIDNLTANGGITSAMVAGETVDIAFDNFFNSPPPDMKAFLPTTFYPMDPKTGTLFGLGGTTKEPIEEKSQLPYRDYNEGNPSGWNIGAFKPYFPSIASNDDIRKAARVLAQSWGGWVVGIPFSMVVF